MSAQMHKGGGGGETTVAQVVESAVQMPWGKAWGNLNLPPPECYRTWWKGLVWFLGTFKSQADSKEGSANSP